MAEVITLPGVKGSFAVGLSWRHEAAPPSSKDLRARSIERGRWGFVRKTPSGSVQVCNCDPITGVANPAKAKILAAMVADHRREPWMGLYELDKNRYWYIAVRDGGEVIVDGDRVGSREDLMRIRDRHLTLGPWEDEIEGTVDDLARIVHNAPKQASLKDFQKRIWVPVAIGCALATTAAAVVGGYWYYQDQQEQAQAAQAAERTRVLEAARQARNDAEAKILPWTKEPMAQPVLATCMSAWHSQALAQAGWTLGEWQCDVNPQGAAIATTWTRQGGVAANAPGKLSPDAQTSTLSVQLAATYGSPSALALPGDEATRAIWSLAQSRGLTLKFTTNETPTPVLPGTTPEKVAPPLWITNETEFTLTTPPWSNGIAAGFDSLPGLRLKKVKWTAATRQWTVASTLYALRATSAEYAHTDQPSVHQQTSVGGRT